MSTPSRNTSDPRWTRPRRFRAFTLVEMMITMLIVAIAAALAVPMLGDTSQTKLREAGKLLASDLGQAQVETLAHGDAPRAIVFQPNQDSYYIAIKGGDDFGTPLNDEDNGQPRRTTFGQGRVRQLSGVKIKSVSTDDNRLCFGAYGNLDTGSDDEVTVTLTCGNYRITLTIDTATGEVIDRELNSIADPS